MANKSKKNQVNKKVEFIVHQETIKKMLAGGYSILSIHTFLKDKNSITCSYRQLYRLIKKNLNSGGNYPVNPISNSRPSTLAVKQYTQDKPLNSIEGIKPSNKTIEDLW